MAKREVRPREGDRVRFITWLTETEPLEGYVISLLDIQFTILGDNGYTYYKFYRDHGAEWKVIQDNGPAAGKAVDGAEVERELDAG